MQYHERICSRIDVDEKSVLALEDIANPDEPNKADLKLALITLFESAGIMYNVHGVYGEMEFAFSPPIFQKINNLLPYLTLK